MRQIEIVCPKCKKVQEVKARDNACLHATDCKDCGSELVLEAKNGGCACCRPDEPVVARLSA